MGGVSGNGKERGDKSEKTRRERASIKHYFMGCMKPKALYKI